MARKILYFIAGIAPTATESAQIANIVGDVQIRSNLRPALYGDKLEPADGLAGTIPAAYLTGEGDTVDTDLYPAGDVTPLQGGITLKVFPVNPGGIAANGGAGTSVITASYDPDGGSGEAAITATTTATFV